MRHEHFTGLSKGLVATERGKDTDASYNIITNVCLSATVSYAAPPLAQKKQTGPPRTVDVVACSPANPLANQKEYCTVLTAISTVQGSQGQCALERVFEDAASEIITISPSPKRTILYITFLCLNKPSSSTVRACFCTSGVSTPEKRRRNKDFPIFAPSRGGIFLRSPKPLGHEFPRKKTTKARSPFNKGAKPLRREASSHKSPSASPAASSGRGFFVLSRFFFSSPGRNSFSSASSSPPRRSSTVSDCKFSSVNSM